MDKKKWFRKKKSIRKKLSGTFQRPRMTVFRSARHIFAQVIDDVEGKTLVSASTLDKDVKEKISAEMDKKTKAEVVGRVIAEKCKTKEIEKIVFDRNGFAYHGRIKKLADSSRKHGLIF